MAKKHKKAKKDATKKQCCCSSGSSCCEKASSDTSRAYSCADDPYRGSLQKVVVDFLYLDLCRCERCTGADQRIKEAVDRCRDVLFACGYDISLNMVHVDSVNKAEHYRFESSPTIRVNGVDTCPSVRENDCSCCSDISGAHTTCRIFPFNGTYYEVPPTDMLIRAILEIVLQNRRPLDPPNPYKLPDNLRDFFAHADRKSKKRGKSQTCKCKCTRKKKG